MQRSGSPDEHLVDENAERPPVNLLAMATPLNDLRRQVFGCAAQRVCPPEGGGEEGEGGGEGRGGEGRGGEGRKKR